METLDSHNRQVIKLRDAPPEKHAAGVSCDECGAEMHYSTPHIVHSSIPPCKSVRCPKCGNSGLKRR